MNPKIFSARIASIQLRPCLAWRILGVILILLLTSCGGSAQSTPPSSSPTQNVVATAPQSLLTTPSPEATEHVETPSISTPVPAIPERRELTLEYPPKIRAGDSDIVRLTLEVNEHGDITPTA